MAIGLDTRTGQRNVNRFGRFTRSAYSPSVPVPSPTNSRTSNSARYPWEKGYEPRSSVMGSTSNGKDMFGANLDSLDSMRQREREDAAYYKALMGEVTGANTEAQKSIMGYEQTWQGNQNQFNRWAQAALAGGNNQTQMDIARLGQASQDFATGVGFQQTLEQTATQEEIARIQARAQQQSNLSGLYASILNGGNFNYWS